MPSFDNSYAALPERFYTRVSAEPSSAPRIIRVNRDLAEQLDIDPDFLESDDGAAVATGNAVLPGASPIATIYAGHQFGSWNPRLGDGRALLVGELIARDGARFDLQLKGSGRTPYSRSGDGRSPLGPVLREYLVSEAMTAFGIPSSRALAAAATGDLVRRDTLLPGAVLMRVARSHIRIGTFEYFASVNDVEALRLLVTHVLERHYPEVEGGERPAVELLRHVARRQASLVAKWQQVGFVHGVMNTDNMLLSGETIDYGPCAFIDTYDPAAVFSSIDHTGRYAFQNQPAIAQWNLSRLARALLPVTGMEDRVLEDLQVIIDTFPETYASDFTHGMAHKLGLSSLQEGDASLIDELLAQMREIGCDYTLTLRALCDLADPDGSPEGRLGALYVLPETLTPWLTRWHERLASEPLSPAERARAMRAVNPIFIPRNYLVEEAIEAAVLEADFSAFHGLAEVLAEPFVYRSELERFARQPSPEQRSCVTFCGT